MAASSYGQRKSDRVTFDRGVPVHIISIDGTWRRDCSLLDISATGARLLINGSIEGLNLKEFFLALSKSGSVFRRCEMIRVNGDELGVRFLEREKKKTPGRAAKGPPTAA
jgi:hypothetical protein